MSAKKPARVTPEGLRAEIVAEVTAERERIAEVVRGTREGHAAKLATHGVAMKRWEAEAADARREYRPEPSRPESPDTLQERLLLDRMHHAEDDAFKREQKVLGWKRLEIQTAWDQVRPELAAEAEEALAPLHRLLATVDGWKALIRESRAAHETADGRRDDDGPSHRMRPSIGIPDLVELADGIDILTPAPLPPVARDREAADAGERAAFRVQEQARRDDIGVRKWL